MGVRCQNVGLISTPVGGLHEQDIGTLLMLEWFHVPPLLFLDYVALLAPPNILLLSVKQVE